MLTYEEITGKELPEECIGCMFKNYSPDCLPCTDCGIDEETGDASEYIPEETA